MREPLTDPPCVKGVDCEGNFICKDGFTLMAYPDPVAYAYYREYGKYPPGFVPNFCVLCTRVHNMEMYLYVRSHCTSLDAAMLKPIQNFTPADPVEQHMAGGQDWSNAAASSSSEPSPGGYIHSAVPATSIDPEEKETCRDNGIRDKNGENENKDDNALQAHRAEENPLVPGVLKRSNPPKMYGTSNPVPDMSAASANTAAVSSGTTPPHIKPMMISNYTNIIGPGEYSPADCIIGAGSRNYEGVVCFVMHSRSKYTFVVKNGVRWYVQHYTKPLANPAVMDPFSDIEYPESTGKVFVVEHVAAAILPVYVSFSLCMRVGLLYLSTI